MFLRQKSLSLEKKHDMSEHKLSWKIRKNKHERVEKGSRFPRHSMDYFPGTHIGMRLRYKKPTVGRLYSEKPEIGGIRYTYISRFISKFVGKPFPPLEEAFYYRVRTSGMLRRFSNTHPLERFLNLRNGTFFVDEEGIVRSRDSVPPKIHTDQIRHNVQEMARVQKRLSTLKEKGGSYGSIFLGMFWCWVEGKLSYSPVYHVPEGRVVLEFYKRLESSYLGVTRNWNGSGRASSPEEVYAPNSRARVRTIGLQKHYVVPIIPFRKKDPLRIRTMCEVMYHTHRIYLIDPEKVPEACLKNPDVPQQIYIDKGLGPLYPMVRL